MTNIDNWEVANFKSLVELNINNANSVPIAYGCTSLTTVNLNDNVTKLGNTPTYQFSGCSALETIKLPSSLEEICASTFINTGLKEITIPANVKNIGRHAFYNCSQLESVVFEENSQLETICAYAFSDCTSLKTITIPANVKEIEFNAFYNCYNLEKVTFEEKLQLTTISEYAFYNCKLNFVDFTPIENLTTIKEYAFGSNNISGIYLPKTIKVIENKENNIFYSQYVFFEGTETEWQQVSNLNPYWQNTVIYNVETVEKVNGYFLVNGTDIYYIS
jgi:hypothetical protein